MTLPAGLPTTTEIGDRIVQIRLPMTGNPMRYINGYLLEDEDGLTLIDCGWKGDDVLAALEEGLAEHGRTVRDVRRLLVTHFHMDHYGLAGTLVEMGIPELGMHERDWEFIRMRSTVDDDTVVNSWLQRNGLPVDPDEDDDDTDRKSVV